MTAAQLDYASLAIAPAHQLAEAVRRKQISSRELLDVYLDRIERLNPPVNAVITLDVERARAAALRADEMLARGEVMGPLHGLPITVKDALETEGIRSTGGAIELTDHVPAADAPAVAALKAAGAIVFGKTNVPRWSGDLQTYNEIFGTTSNPWSLDRVPGGSSGGAAAAVACGFTSFETGTDIGGSVRVPSHCCGVFGLKPSFGVVPQRGYLDQVGGGITDADINVFGPIARSAADLELLLGILTGPEPERRIAWRLELPAPRRTDIRDLRIGYWFDEPGVPIDREYRALLGAAADRLAEAGARVEAAHPPVDFKEQTHLFQQMIVAAIAPSMAPDVAESASGSHLTWLRNERRRAELRRIWAGWFESYDLLLCPVLPVPAFRHDQEGELFARTVEINGEEHSYLSCVQWTGLIGIVLHPAAVAPIGRTAAGVPVGMQIVAGYLRDREAVRGAAIVEELLGGYTAPPGFGPR